MSLIINWINNRLLHNRLLSRIKPTLSSYDPPVNIVKDYTILFQPRPCNPTVDLILGIKSLVTNYERRRQIRNGWGAAKYYPNYSIKRVFLFGNSHLKKLEPELEFDDVLAGDFRESFYNLTFKDSMLFSWAAASCNAKFIFKVSELKFKFYRIKLTPTLF